MFITTIRGAFCAWIYTLCYPQALFELKQTWTVISSNVVLGSERTVHCYLS